MQMNIKNCIKVGTYSLGAFLWIIVLSILFINNLAFAQSQQPFITISKKIESDKSGLSNPTGIVFSSRANVFHVVEASNQAASKSVGTVIKNISVLGRPSGTSQIGTVFDSPINTAMDNKNGRLLIYQVSTAQIIEIHESTSGYLDPNSLTAHSALIYRLQDPQGMAFDSVGGYLYILDAVGPRVVRIKEQRDGSIEGVLFDSVLLSWAGKRSLRGIAYEPVSGDLFITDPQEQKLYEINNTGQLISTRDLSEFHLHNIQGIVFAPSADQTDDPSLLSLFLADSGAITTLQNYINSDDKQSTFFQPGEIAEFTFIEPPKQVTASFSSNLVRTTDMAAYTPPSPDPSGLTYIAPSNTLLMCDGEVEETVSGITHFMGANIWEINLNGTVVRSANISPVNPTFVPMSDEPTGSTWSPINGHYYFSDDNALKVFDLNPGADGVIGTGDDSWTSFSTSAAGSGDPEGIAYDTWSNQLFVVDGTNREIYQFTLTGSLVNHFDVQVYGISDPESVEFNPVSNTLFILGGSSNRMIIETTTSGILLQTIDISANSSRAAAGLAFAPASDGTGAMHFYIVDRGIDNNDNPNIIDGKMYEMTAPVPNSPGNTPPEVNAGVDQSISIDIQAALNGSAVDDGFPNPPGALTTQWSSVSGPGIVTFTDPSALVTSASFSAVGTYILRLSASDSELISYDEITIIVTGIGGSMTREVRVVTSSDDAEETSSGSVNLTSSDLELVEDASIQTVGIRFRTIIIPKSSQIINAYIQFQVDELSSVSTSLTIWGEAQDNPATFTTTNHNISSRSKTFAAVAWSPPPWTVEGQAGVDQRSPDLSAIIQEIVNRSGWSEGNSLVIIVGGSGVRTAEAYDGSHAGAPLLHIEYIPYSNMTPTATTTSTPSPTPTITPTRTSQPTNTLTPTLTNTPLPTYTSTGTPSNTPLPTPTATKTNASTALPTNTATMTPSNTSQPPNTTTPTPSNTPTPSYTPISSHTYTPTPTSTFTLTPSNTFTPTISNTPTPTRTLTPTPTSTLLPTSTFTPTSSYTPASTSTFTPTSSPAQIVIRTMDVMVRSSSDDAEESTSGSVSFTDNLLELVYDTSNQLVGIRFKGISIPQGAIILNAYIQFSAAGVDTGPTSLIIYGQAEDNPASFNRSKKSISNRLLTTAWVEWNPVGWIIMDEAGENQRTADIATIIQEIVNRPTWLSGNAMVFIISGTGKRTAYAYNGLPQSAPMLHIEYISP
jgi:hypothetical protein